MAFKKKIETRILPLLTNFLGHKVQANGVSPVCLNTCCLRFELLLKPLPQIEHKNGVSPVWILR